MNDVERILLESRYLLSLNKKYHDLALIFQISDNHVYDDLNYKLKEIDTLLYKRVQNVLNSKNNP